jgi:iron complex outermembrane receptor protein
MKFYRNTICLLMATIYANQAYAATESTDTLPEVKVTEKRTTQDASITQATIEEAIKEINKTAGGVTVVDAEQLREGRVSNFNDTLGMATGVFAQSRFGAEESRLSIRGSGLQRTFHGRGIKLMQDGIPVNIADGGFDFQSIEPLSTRYIEVFRGANALRYGSSNLGGAVNFISPTGYDAPKFEARSEFGSFGYQRLGLAASGVVGNLDYFISTSTFRQDGYRDYSNQSAERTNANVGYRFNDNVETRFYMGYVNSVSQLPGSLTKARFKDDPEQANAGAVAGQQKRDIDLWRFANKTTILLENAKLELSAYYSNKTLFHPIFQVLDQKTDDYGLEARYSQKGELFGRKNEFVVGFIPSYAEINDKRWVNVRGSRGAQTNEYAQTAANLETYAENRWFALPDLALITGVQYTKSTRKQQDKFITGGSDESYDLSYTQTSPKLGLLYQLAPAIQLYTNVSRSFEPPSFSELAGGLTPNINKAQKGTTFEVGSRGNSQYVDWDVSAYYAKLTDELLQTAVSATVPGNTINAPHTIHTGLEMGMTARLPANLEWRHNLLINEFRFDDDATFGNNRLAGIPRSLLRGELLYRKNGFYIGPTIETSPQKYAIDFAETLYTDSYTLFGWKMGQQINQQWSWFLDARNLADRKYIATTGVISVLNTSNTFRNNEAQFFPGDGRSVYAGIQWRY